MPRALLINIYDIKESCRELASRVGRTKPYNPKTIYYFIKEYKPDLEKAGQHYFLTDYDLDSLAKSIKKTRGRPRNIT